MNDNASPQRANIVNQYFETETLKKKMEQPLKSPDLNPIKHVLDIFKGCYSSKGEQHKVLTFVISIIVL